MSAAVDLGSYRRIRESIDVEYLLRQLDVLKGRRSNWDAKWDEIARRIWPAAMEFQGRAKSTRSSGGGEKRTAEILDATGALALERFAAILESINTPQSDIWHELQSSKDFLKKDHAAKAWYEDVNTILWNERRRAQAGYQTQMQDGYKSIGAFGGCPLYIDAHPEGGLRYRYVHVNQLYIETDHVGRVDTIYRVFPLTARQAVQQFGDRAGERVRSAIQNGRPFHDFDFLQVIRPQNDRDPSALGPRGMRYQGIYIGMEDRQLIREEGFEEMPLLYSRWSPGPSEVYGRSVAEMALPHIKTANAMQKTHLSAGEKALNPPLLAPDESAWMQGGRTIDLRPGGVTYGAIDMQGRPMLQPLSTGTNVPLLETMLETERGVIKDWFYVSLFQAILEDPKANVTATYWLQRAQEKGDLIAPPMARLQTELYGPQIDRELSLLARQGRIPPPPPSVIEAGAEYDIEYVNEAARLQNSRKVLGIRNTIDLQAALAPLDPRAALKLKLDEAIEVIADYEGVPTELVRTTEEIDAIVAQQQQAQAMAQQVALFQQGAAGAKDATAALQQVASAGQIRSETTGPA